MSPRTRDSTGEWRSSFLAATSRPPSIVSRCFEREAKAAAALNHPNIVHLYSVEEADGLIFMTMELVDGRSLRELLRDGAPLPLPKVFAFAAQIAEGLACAHAAGVLHRDLKPGNIMITDDDRVKILDFGVAKFFRPASMWDPEAATHEKGATTTRSSRAAGRRSAPSATCLPNRRSARRSMRGRISSRWESCCSKWRPGGRRSRATRRRPSSITF